MENFTEHYKTRKAKAEERASALAMELMKTGRQEHLFRAAEDAEYREALCLEFNL